MVSAAGVLAAALVAALVLRNRKPGAPAEAPGAPGAAKEDVAELAV